MDRLIYYSFSFCFSFSFFVVIDFLLDQKVKQKIKSHRSCGFRGAIVFALFLFPALIWTRRLGQSEKQKQSEKQNENEYSKTSSLHLLISSSPHPLISSSPHLLIPSSPHPFISSSPHLLIPNMRIIYRLYILEGLMRFVGWKMELFGNQKNRRFSLSED